MLRNMMLLGMGPIQLQDLKSILSVHIQNFSSDWKAGVHAHIPRATTAIVDIYDEVDRHLKVTPLTPQYRFTLRDVYRIVNGMQLVEGSHMSGKTGFELITQARST